MDGKGTSIKDYSPLKVLAGQNVYLGISSTGGGAHKSVNKLIVSPAHDEAGHRVLVNL